MTVGNTTGPASARDERAAARARRTAAGDHPVADVTLLQQQALLPTASTEAAAVLSARTGVDTQAHEFHGAPARSAGCARAFITVLPSARHAPAAERLSFAPPAPFYGDDYLPITFRSACESWLSLTQVPPQDAVKTLGLRTLRGYAEAWFFNTLQTERFASLDAYFDALQERFRYGDERDYVNMRWHNLLQGDRTVHQFTRDFDMLALQVTGLSEAARLRKYRYSLSDAVMAKLQDDPTVKDLNLQQLQCAAAQAESALRQAATAPGCFPGC
jgi:Retrotransposon gag protein